MDKYVRTKKERRRNSRGMVDMLYLSRLWVLAKGEVMRVFLE